jgi:hypothetical protein
MSIHNESRNVKPKAHPTPVVLADLPETLEYGFQHRWRDALTNIFHAKLKRAPNRNPVHADTAPLGVNLIELEIRFASTFDSRLLSNHAWQASWLPCTAIDTPLADAMIGSASTASTTSKETSTCAVCLHQGWRHLPNRQSIGSCVRRSAKFARFQAAASRGRCVFQVFAPGTANSSRLRSGGHADNGRTCRENRSR